MELELAIYCIGICSLAAIVHGSIGFGFPMLATPLMALLTDVQTAIMLTIIPSIYINTISIKSEGPLYASVKKHFQLIAYTATGSLLGTGLLLFCESDIFKVILALAIAFYLITDSFNVRCTWVKKNPAIAKLSFGLVSGFIGGLTNVMAPTLIIYALEIDQPKKDTIQSLNLCFLFGKVTQLILFSIGLKFTGAALTCSMGILVSAIMLTYIGIKLKNLINEVFYKIILKIILCSIALGLIFQSAS